MFGVHRAWCFNGLLAAQSLLPPSTTLHLPPNDNKLSDSVAKAAKQTASEAVRSSA